MEIYDFLVAWPQVPVLHLSNLLEDRLEDELSTSAGLKMTPGCLAFLVWELETRTDDVSARMDVSGSWEFAACDARPLELRVGCIIVGVL